MIKPGTTVIVEVVRSETTRPLWTQKREWDDNTEDCVFEVIVALPRSTEQYAWYDTNKGTVVIHDHNSVAVL